MIVPTTEGALSLATNTTSQLINIPGMKLSGRYMTYLIRVFGVNFENGFLRILPNLPIGSWPDFNCRPSLTIPIASFATSVPSKVSSSASCKRKLREMMLTIVELSLRIRSTVVKTAKGPFTKTRIASCGR